MSTETASLAAETATQGPAISVVVAARNEERYIEACVRSLLDQHQPTGGFEVIVAEGMSDDSTRAILDKLAQDEPRLRVIDNVQRITPAGFNAGIRAARGRFIAIMNAHSRVAPDYLARCLEVADRQQADNVGGAPIADAKGYVQRAVAATHHSPFSVGSASWHFVGYEGPSATVFGGFYRREVFDRIGLFDETLIRNNYQELNFRLQQAGGRIWQSPDIRMWYTPRSSLGRLFRQYQQFGYFKVLVLLKHGRVPALRHYVPALLVLGLALMALAALVAGLVALVLPGRGLDLSAEAAIAIFALAATSYVGVLLVASFSSAAEYGWDLLPILPVTFATYHFSYGLGFLRGVFDFMIRRRRAPAQRLSQINR